MRESGSTHRSPSEASGAENAGAEVGKGQWSERYPLLDAWRGLAALAVCVHHVAGVLIGGMAVMIFFVISGYCIAASVDSCQQRGLGLGTFMKRRLHRFYPPYLLSIALWAVTRVVKKMQTGENDFAKFTWVDWVQNLTMTQWISLVFHPQEYAARNPGLFVAAYWSLCYEEQFYLVMGLMMLLAGAVRGRFRVGVLAMTAALMGAGLVVNVIFPEVSCGFFIEYWVLFGIGVLVFHRLCRIESAGMRRAIDAGLAVLMVGAAFMRWFSGRDWKIDHPAADGAEFRNVYQELAIAAAFGLLLIAMRPVSRYLTSFRLYKPFAWLGAITFSFYLIHQFNVTLVRTIVAKIFAFVPAELPVLGPVIGRGVDHPHMTWLGMILQIMVHLALASVFWYFCERPFLNKSLLASGELSATGPRGIDPGR